MKKEKAIDCLPCPFCGSEPVQVLLGEQTYITCDNMECPCYPGTFSHIEPDEPRRAWNTRLVKACQCSQ